MVWACGCLREEGRVKECGSEGSIGGVEAAEVLDEMRRKEMEV
jgi:hypothetical protein